jgi:ABC-type bacteriocin/lantibiotic exporter with double-glycine peptidase domain
MNARSALFFFLTFKACVGAVLAAQPPGIWIDVPFVAQVRDGCGSAAISMVMQYWENQAGHAASNWADPVRIQSLLYSPAEGGIPASKMRTYFQEAGYHAFAFSGNWDDLKHHIQEGRPMIVSLKASGPLGPLHYVVVAGVDTEREYVYLNDPAQQKLMRISREGFESEWKPTHNWTLLAVPQSGDQP